jgi:transposase-like protein
MENYTLKTRPFYSDSFKLMVIKRVVSGELTREGARRVYGIGGVTTILKWMIKFGYCDHPQTHAPMSEPTKRIDTTENGDDQDLQKRIQLLEKQLHNERVRSQLYRTMIEVAERELGIAIRKKSDTNPSD